MAVEYKEPWHPNHPPQPDPKKPWVGGKDMQVPDPATGPMSTKGPFGTSEGLPKSVEVFDRKSNDCGAEIGLDAIKSAGKNGGKY